MTPIRPVAVVVSTSRRGTREHSVTVVRVRGSETGRRITLHPKLKQHPQPS